VFPYDLSLEVPIVSSEGVTKAVTSSKHVKLNVPNVQPIQFSNGKLIKTKASSVSNHLCTVHMMSCLATTVYYLVMRVQQSHNVPCYRYSAC
jgi:hypothetical protein